MKPKTLRYQCYGWDVNGQSTYAGTQDVPIGTRITAELVQAWHADEMRIWPVNGAPELPDYRREMVALNAWMRIIGCSEYVLVDVVK